MTNNTPKIKGFINKILAAEKERFAKTLIKEFQTNFPNDFVATFSRVYDQTLLSGGEMKDDPTSPEQIKSEVLATVRSRTEEAVGRLTAEGGDIHIKGLAKEDLGFIGGDSVIPASFKNPPKQFLFAFYIVGMVGNLVFISNETFRKMGLKPGSLGRFSEGFLMDGNKYKKMLARQAKSGSKKSLPSYEEVLHPFSGKGPINFFGILRNNIDLGKYISAAVKKMRAK